MAMVLDLRRGQHFKHPETNMNTTRTTAGAQTKKNNDNDEDENDDLDDLISSASSVKKSSLSTSEDQVGELTKETRQPVAVPRLLASEQVILKTLLEIWLTLLQDNNEKVQQIAWRQDSMVIRMIWEMALLSLPPTPYTSVGRIATICPACRGGQFVIFIQRY